MRILIVEDHSGIQIALKMLLELEGFESDAVFCGEEALAYLEHTDCDVILLDLATDGMSAGEFMKALRAMYQTRGEACPVVGVMSGNPKIESEARAIQADFLIRKPFDHDLLVRKISSHGSARGPQARPDISGASA